MKTLAKRFKQLSLLATLCCTAAAQPVEATHGLFPMGYGTKAIGMGGGDTAYAHDTLLSSNPAGMAFICDGFDISGRIFNPRRHYSYTSAPDHVESGWRFHPIPAMGFKCTWNDCWTYGFSLLGNGGMNTDYPRNNGVFGDTVRLGIDYGEVVLAPAVAYTPWEGQSFGVAVLLGMGRIKIWGLNNFNGNSIYPGDVSDRGYDYNFGIGVRVGWNGYLLENVMGGIAYSSPVLSTAFKHYRGLFPDKGKVHFPGHFDAGLKWEVTPCTNVTADVKYIFYGQLRPHSQEIARFFAGQLLGTKEGPGFGWSSIWVGKIGIEQFIGDCWAVRAGYSFGEKPYPSSEMDFNIIAPAVTTDHVAIGGSWFWDECSQVDFAYGYTFEQDITGTSSFGLGTVRHKMFQHNFAMQYGRRF